LLKELMVRIGADPSGVVKAMTTVGNEIADATNDFRNFGNNVSNVFTRLEVNLNNVENNIGQFSAQATARFGVMATQVSQHFNRMSSNINREFNEIKTNFRQTINETEASTDALAGVGANMTAMVTLPIIAAGAASIKLSSDFSESVNKINVAFGSSASEVMAWSKTSIEQMGLASGSALDAAALFGDMATSMGISQQKAADMAMSLTQLGADLASFKNIPIEQAMQALNGVFTGETESLKMLGVVMTETQLKAFALEQGITKNVEKMTEAEMVALRYAFVMDRTKNSQGDFARTSEGSANQMRMFGELMKEIGVQLGTVILPVFNEIIKSVNEKLKAFSGLSEGTKKLIVVSGLLAAALGPVLLVIGSIVPSIVTAVAAYRALGVAMTVTAGTAMTAGTTMAAGMAVATAPITLITAAIAALVAGSIYLAKNWESVSERLKSTILSISPAFYGLINVFKYLMDNWEDVKATAWALTQYVSKWWKDAFDSMATITTTRINQVKTLVSNLQAVFASAFPDISGIFKKAFDAMATSISTVSGLFNQFLKWISDTFGVAFENSAFAVEMAEYKKQYALEKTIEKMQENAGKTDYMTDRTLIMTGTTKEAAAALEAEKVAAEKAAEAKRIAAERAKQLAAEQEKLIASSVKLADQLGNAVVSALKSQYSKQEEAQRNTLLKMQQTQTDHYTKLNVKLKEQYDKDVAAFKETQQKKMDELKKFFDADMQAIDKETRDKVKNLNDQILDIENKTEEEEKIIKAADFEKERQAKQTAILLADNEAERRKLIEELKEMEIKRERELLLEQRRMQIEALRKAAELIREDGENRKKERENQYNAELEAEKSALETGLTNLQTNFNNRKQVYDGLLETIKTFYAGALERNKEAFEKEKAEDKLQKEAREGILKGEQKDLLDLLATYNPDWLNAGKTFGEKLLEGILKMSPSIDSAVQTMLDKVKPLTVTPTKKTGKTTTGGTKVTGAAYGGIFTSPTLAMVGDGGQAEAILPLSRLAEITGQQSTHIYLDGREITRSVAPLMVDSIRTKLGVAY